MPRKGFAPIFVIIIVAVALALGGGALYYAKKISAPKPVACTQDAKQCPDGSYVGRTGPNCEFAACPTTTSTVQSTSTQDETAGWRTYRNEKYGFEVKYPQNLTVNFDNKEWMSGSDYYGKRDFNLLIMDSKIEPSVPLPTGDVTPDSKFGYGGYNFSIFSGDAAIKHLAVENDLIAKNPTTLETVNIGGMPRSLYSTSIDTYSSKSPKGTLYSLYFSLGDKYTIIVDSGVVYKNYNKQTLIQILSTFKFISPEGKFCGGIAAFQCTTGYVCKLDGAYPDAGGRCMKPDGTGTLRGQVTIGPNCPVERIDNPCVTPPEAYASREFLVTKADTKKTIATFHADMNGNYIVSLAPGNYMVTSAKTGIGFMSKDLPRTITIQAGQTTTMNIDVDTGIR